MKKDPSIITFHGKNAEETVVVVIAGVHGNEICGIEALRKILKEIETGGLQILRGTVHFIFARPRERAGKEVFILGVEKPASY